MRQSSTSPSEKLITMAKSAETSPVRVLGAASAFIESLAKHTGIKTLETQQQLLLLSLYIHGDLNQLDLERYTGMRKSSNSRNIARLGEGEHPSVERGPGWVESYEDPENRRSKLVRLTPRGKALLEKVAAEVSHLFSAK
jgi:DNA-binding MarR family transcriptional regulator